MYLTEREAMWIRFKSRSQFAIKIYLGGVNAVSGEPMIENAATQLRRQKLKADGESIQDYVVTPKQKWLDGIASTAGVMRQFVAMPMGSGYSVEAQVTGQELTGGLQFEITPQVHEIVRNVVRTPEESTKRIQILVRALSGKNFTLRVPVTITIEEIKTKIEKREGIPPDQQRLLWCGGQLEDGKLRYPCEVTEDVANYDPLERTIDSYGIQHVSGVDFLELGTSVVLMWTIIGH